MPHPLAVPLSAASFLQSGLGAMIPLRARPSKAQHGLPLMGWSPALGT